MTTKTRTTKPAAVPAEGITPATPEPYITVAEASDFLGIPPNTCYKLALRREIPSFKCGKLRRFLRSDLRAWMESHRVNAAG
jgi:excisionase family DNA binding protein